MENKFKARKPEETIKIVKDFFTSRGCKIENVHNWHSEIDTYSCEYKIVYNDKTILEARGKGTTEVYAHASCCGELYERFCAFPISCWNSFNYDKLMELNKEINNYYLASDEKESSIEELLNNSFTKPYLLNTNSELNKEILEQFFNIRMGDRIVEIPYTNFDKTAKQQQIYTTPLLHGLTSGSNGLAAGNTLQEALIQGISELYERYVQTKISLVEEKAYYYLDVKNIAPHLQKLIYNLENLGYDIKIYDLSYNYNVPVCMVYILDKNTYHYYYHLGAFPVIDIAIERCLTELYQELTSLEKDFNIYGYTKLYSPIDFTLANVMEHSTGGKPEIVISKNLLLNSKKVSQYNDLIFLPSEDFDNDFILERINKINQINKKQFFYRDLSLCDEMAAVHIVCDDFDYTNIDKGNLASYNETYMQDKSFYTTALKMAYNLRKLLKYYIAGSEYEESCFIKELNNIIELVPNNSIDDRIAFLNLVSCIYDDEYLTPYLIWYNGDINNNIPLIYYLVGYIEEVPYSQTTEFAKTLIPLEFYYNYCVKGHNTLEDYNAIMAALGRTDSILEEPLSPAKFTEKAIFKNIYQIYSSQEYNDFIKLFIRR